MQSQQDKIVVFSHDTAPIISEIIKKYNLRETREEAMETIKNGKFFRAGIIFNIVEKIILNNELKKNLISVLQKELNISGDVANNLAKDIENELFAIGKLVSLEEFTQLNKKTKEVKKPITAIPANPMIEILTTEIKPKSRGTPPPKKSTPQIRPIKNGPDSYREPIN